MLGRLAYLQLSPSLSSPPPSWSWSRVADRRRYRCIRRSPRYVMHSSPIAVVIVAAAFVIVVEGRQYTCHAMVYCMARYIAQYTAWHGILHGMVYCMAWYFASWYIAWQGISHRNCMAWYNAWHGLLHGMVCHAIYHAMQYTMPCNIVCNIIPCNIPCRAI